MSFEGVEMSELDLFSSQAKSNEKGRGGKRPPLPRAEREETTVKRIMRNKMASP